MGRYHATVESRHSATETSGYLATFSDAAEWDPECSPGSSWIPARPALAAASGSAWPSGPGCCPSTPPMTTPASTGGPSSPPTPSSAGHSRDRADDRGAGGRAVPADPLAEARAGRAAPSRVITVSSGGMYAQRLDPPTLQLPASRYRGVTVYARARWPGRARHRGWFTGAVVAAGIACCRGHVVAGFGRYWARPGFCET